MPLSTFREELFCFGHRTRGTEKKRMSGFCFFVIDDFDPPARLFGRRTRG